MIKKIRNCNKGMSYVELIVVLSIFSVISSVAIYNYGDFQDRVDIKNLGSDIALKIVEAQKSALNGVLPVSSNQVSGWKPSYGVYFNMTPDDGNNPNPGDNKSFIYFVDLNQDGILDNPDCLMSNGECLDKITITKGNYIDKIEECPDDNTCGGLAIPLSITFKRPDSSAVFMGPSGLLTGFAYIRITIKSPKGATTLIKIYPSGRIQIN
jgi:prepilin-type N-terminal cleavage/methylation domain-containing protein